MPRSFTQPPAWTCKPGGWDTTGTREVFSSTSPLGIPDLVPPWHQGIHLGQVPFALGG